MGGLPLDRIALAAPGDVFCVVSATVVIGPLPACTQVFTDIQPAVDTAGGGEEIRVATGLYTNLHPRAGLTQVVYLGKTVDLRGGYNNDFTARDPTLYPTTLDAQGGGRVFYLTGPLSATIAGFDITGGRATGLGGGSPSNHDDAGGGLYLNGVTVTLRDNRIHHNTVSDQGVSGDPLVTYDGVGGALYLANGSALLENNAIYDNVALEAGTATPNVGLGGGLSIYNSEAGLNNNSIYSNIANHGSGGEGVAGGIYILSSTVTLTGNLIHSNGACLASASSGCALSVGGGVLAELATTTFQYNQILSNTAVISTGAVALGGGVVIAESRATIANNRLAGNKAAVLASIYGDGGGLVLFDNERVSLTDNIFQNNLATSYGGGLYIFNTPTFLTNTVFVANRALTSGAGLLIESGSAVHLRHTTFNDNGLAGSDIHIVDDRNSPGSGPFNTVWLTNTILASYTTGISVTAGNTLTLNSMLWHNVPITISAAAATVAVANAFSGNPAFAADGYHLTAGSAAIGRGVPAGVQTDIDGDPRRPMPDLGADEYGASLPVRLYLPLIVKDHHNQF